MEAPEETRAYAYVQEEQHAQPHVLAPSQVCIHPFGGAVALQRSERRWIVLEDTKICHCHVVVFYALEFCRGQR